MDVISPRGNSRTHVSERYNGAVGDDSLTHRLLETLDEIENFAD